MSGSLILLGNWDAIYALCQGSPADRAKYLAMSPDERLQLFLGDSAIVEGAPNAIRRLFGNDDDPDNVRADAATLNYMKFRPGYRKVGLILNQFAFPWDVALVWQKLPKDCAGYVAESEARDALAAVKKKWSLP